MAVKIAADLHDGLGPAVCGADPAIYVCGAYASAESLASEDAVRMARCRTPTQHRRSHRLNAATTTSAEPDNAGLDIGPATKRSWAAARGDAGGHCRRTQDLCAFTIEFDLTNARRYDIVFEHSTRGGAEVARRAHNPKVVGSNPTPATH